MRFISYSIVRTPILDIFLVVAVQALMVFGHIFPVDHAGLIYAPGWVISFESQNAVKNVKRCKKVDLRRIKIGKTNQGNCDAIKFHRG
jgi:hypothetical protein